MRLPFGQPLEVEVAVQNTSERDGDVVVELYLDRQTTSAALPFRTLQGFQRVHLKASKYRQVRFLLEAGHLGWVKNDGAVMVEPRQYMVSVGGEQPGPGANAFERQFEITGTAPKYSNFSIPDSRTWEPQKADGMKTW
jgi:beta-glucosidase